MAYTPEQREQAVNLYIQDGTAEAARQTGISPSTIKRWANQTGAIDQTKQKNTEAARQALADRRSHLADIILDKAIVFAEALQPGKGSRETATALGILVDKSELLTGRPTERTESLTQTAVDREIETAIEEWRRQFSDS